MNNKNLLYPIIIGLVVIGVVWYLSNYFGYNQYKPAIPTVTKDTVWVKADTVWKSKFIKAKQVPARIDTILLATGQPVEVAISDTVVSIDDSKIWARYYGTPYNFFDISADIREKIIEKKIYITEKSVELHKESFWDKFGISLQAGAGYGLINKQPDVYVGAGIHFKLK